MARRRSTNGRAVQVEDTKICVVMVGLPARGKSFIAQKAQRYLQWLSIDAKTFNVGNYRRTDAPHPSAEFFDTGNVEGETKRRAAAEAAISDMLGWFRQGGVIGILDATNSTKDRREWVNNVCSKEGVEVLFVESKCDNEDLIMANIRDVKTTSPDYKGQDPEKAALDFRNRIKMYEKVYKSIDEDGDEGHLTYLKIMDIGAQVVINRIKDYLQSRVVYYLMNLHIRPRSIWLSRHGESMYNLDGRIGGDADLSPRGHQYAKKLPDLVVQSVGDGRPLTVWTSTLKRTIQTARYLPSNYNQLQWKALDELDAGTCDGMTYQEIKDVYPEDFIARDEDKYNYRAYGTDEERYSADIPAVSTWRGKGSTAKHEDPSPESATI
ncbi:putative fructose- -bisphosphatase protein [Eutypa lata UCREL1]|uniref:Putative fructose--bisphosphatase protein n=1 Tax=Eutypa lata (strain UCR-EL1) TaxID=1287681 RepID=M7SJ93_EUTLA|nr:putative fructose- -bisphosphatase protein [Eutypa lata UCREL1]